MRPHHGRPCQISVQLFDIYKSRALKIIIKSWEVFWKIWVEKQRRRRRILWCLQTLDLRPRCHHTALHCNNLYHTKVALYSTGNRILTNGNFTLVPALNSKKNLTWKDSSPHLMQFQALNRICRVMHIAHAYCCAMLRFKRRRAVAN